VEIIDLLLAALELGATIIWVLFLLSLGAWAAEALATFAQGVVRRRREVAPMIAIPTPPILPPKPTLTLFVRRGDSDDALRPSVQMRGGDAVPGTLRLELVDGEGRLRLRVTRPFPAEARGTELPLPPLAPPPGATVQQMLGWHWDISLDLGDGEPQRWREHPTAIGRLNTEAELDSLATL
jgi:hypothetical protein